MSKESTHILSFIRKTVTKGEGQHDVINGEREALATFTQELVEIYRSKPTRSNKEIIIKTLETAQQDHLVRVAQFLAKNSSKSTAR